MACSADTQGFRVCMKMNCQQSQLTVLLEYIITSVHLLESLKAFNSSEHFQLTKGIQSTVVIITE